MANENKFDRRPKVGLSSCLLGQKVRYDGGHKRDNFLTSLFGKFVDWVPVCPEVELGMGVPREPVRLVGSVAKPRMIGEKTQKDWTDTFNRFASQRTAELAELNLSGYIFKENSPSCGLERVRVYGPSHAMLRQGRGLFAATVTSELPLLPVEEEGRLYDPVLRENFIERVFAYRRWQDLASLPKSLGNLIDFHTRHKFLLLAHSEGHYRSLGRIVAAAKQRPIRLSYEEYAVKFMAALSMHATVKKHANVLAHMMGFFSEQLNSNERQELLGLIADFRRRLIPLIVPITMIAHYARKYRADYLTSQFYLEPSPRELMLRNHV